MFASKRGKAPFFSPGRAASGRHQRLLWGLFVALVALGTCAPNGGLPGRPGGKASEVRFQTGEVRAVDARERAEANAAAMEEAGKVVEMLNSYYRVAFVDPQRWEGGKHPDLAGLFTDEARPSVASNLGGLALADLAPRLKTVSPTRQEATKVSFELEDNLSSLFAIATVTFEGTGAARARKDTPVALKHNAVFWLAKQADAWKIAAYQARLEANTVSRSAAWPSSQRPTEGGRAA